MMESNYTIKEPISSNVSSSGYVGDDHSPSDHELINPQVIDPSTQDWQPSNRQRMMDELHNLENKKHAPLG